MLLMTDVQTFPSIPADGVELSKDKIRSEYVAYLLLIIAIRPPSHLPFLLGPAISYEFIAHLTAIGFLSATVKLKQVYLHNCHPLWFFLNRCGDFFGRGRRGGSCAIGSRGAPFVCCQSVKDWNNQRGGCCHTQKWPAHYLTKILACGKHFRLD